MCVVLLPSLRCPPSTAVCSQVSNDKGQVVRRIQSRSSRVSSPGLGELGTHTNTHTSCTSAPVVVAFHVASNSCTAVSCPLVQVVQDFVQQTADEETPKEWLHRIMETNSREEGEHDINLLGNHILTHITPLPICGCHGCRLVPIIPSFSHIILFLHSQYFPWLFPTWFCIIPILLPGEKQSCKQHNTHIVHLNINAVITGCNVFSTSHILCTCHCHGGSHHYMHFIPTILELCSNIP